MCFCVCDGAVFAKGQMVTRPYQFLARYGGYMWLETSASIVAKSAFEETEIVVCINHTIRFSITSLLIKFLLFFLHKNLYSQ